MKEIKSTHFNSTSLHRKEHTATLRYLFTIFQLYRLHNESWDSTVDIVTGYTVDDQWVGVRILVGVKNFHFSILSRPALGTTQPPIQRVPRALSPRSKAVGV
jgi:hypothetical protein